MRSLARSPLPWLGGLLALYLLAPILAFVVRLRSGASAAPGLGSALLTSLLTATITTALIAVLGTPLAYVLARGRAVVTRPLTALVALPLALPPLMSGLLLLYVVGPYTTIGRLFGGRLTDTRVGIVLAQTFVAAPFLVIVARAAFASVEPALEDVAASLGHGRLSRFVHVAIPAALPGIGAGLLLAWLRAFGEFGATLILAYHPYSLPVFTFVQFDATGLPATMLPIAVALSAAIAVLALVSLPFPRGRRRSGAPVAQAPARSVPASRLDFAFAKRLGTFSLEVAYAAQSSRLALLGPSGAGKTLTLRLLAGLSAPDRPGHVLAGGRKLDPLPAERRGLGYVPQQPALLPRRTVWQQVILGADAQPDVAAWWIERLGLRGLEGRYPEELSGGQQRRVAIARALAIEPRVLLLDEPFAGLDALMRERLRRELRRLQREANLSTVLVTHDPQEAAVLADEIIVIDHGQVLQAGPRASILRSPRSPEVAALLGIANTRHGVVLGHDLIGSSGTELLARTGESPVGADVVWCVRPERVLPAHDGRYAGVLLDAVDLGAVHELTISLEGGLELVARTADAIRVTVGQPLRVHISPEDITVWARERAASEASALAVPYG